MKTKSLRVYIAVILTIITFSCWLCSVRAASWDHHGYALVFGVQYDRPVAHTSFYMKSYVYVNVIYLHSGRPGWYIYKYEADGNVKAYSASKEWHKEFHWENIQESVKVYKTYGRIYKVVHTISGKVVNNADPSEYAIIQVTTWCGPTRGYAALSVIEDQLSAAVCIDPEFSYS